MSHPRLHITDPLGMARSVILDGDRHHYLTNVMRRKTGDKVALFNGVDGEWLAVVTAVLNE